MRSLMNLSQLNKQIFKSAYGFAVGLRTPSSNCVNSLNANSHQQIRTYSAKKKDEEKVEEEFKTILKSFATPASQFKHLAYTSAFGIPRVFNEALIYLFVLTRMSQIDPEFDKKQFANDCKEVMKDF